VPFVLSHANIYISRFSKMQKAVIHLKLFCTRFKFCTLKIENALFPVGFLLDVGILAADNTGK